jgi:hypothetical protein
VLRKENGGGVAVVGASRGATSGYCDRLLNGLFAAMYADYRPVGVIPGSATRGPLIYMGDIFRAGKHVMYEWVRSPSGRGKQSSAEYCLQTFHLFGDPMLRVRLPRAGVAD